MVPRSCFEAAARNLPRALAVALLLAAASPAWAHHIEKTFPVGEKPVVTVHNASGTITIHSWDKPAVQVVADHTSNKVEVDATQNGNLIDVRTHILSEDIRPEDLAANYEISVPEQAELQIHNDSGMVAITRVTGEMTLETVAANVQLEQAAGHLSIITVGGSFTCLECAGRIYAKSISGNLSVIRAESPSVRLQSSSGDILLDSGLLPNGLYVLKNYSGQIVVRFSPTDSFDLSATSVQGKVESEATLKPPTHINRHLAPGLTRSLFGTFNEGRAQVELTSFSGTIQIRKRN